MTLAKCAASAVLARQSHTVSLGDQAAIGERLCSRPVEALAAGEHFFLRVEDPLQGLVDRKTFRDRGQDLAQAPELTFIDGSRDVAASKYRLVRAPESGPAPFEPICLVGPV